MSRLSLSGLSDRRSAADKGHSGIDAQRSSTENRSLGRAFNGRSQASCVWWLIGTSTSGICPALPDDRVPAQIILLDQARLKDILMPYGNCGARVVVLIHVCWLVASLALAVP